MAKKKERRKHRRFEVEWPVTIQTATSLLEGQATNISAAGIRINYPAALHPDDIIRIFIIPPDHEVIVISGELIWSGPSKPEKKRSKDSRDLCSMLVPVHDRKFLRKLINKNFKKTPKSGKSSKSSPDIS
jgi:hypothetical protein